MFKIIKEKLIEATIHGMVLGMGALILYAVSIALVGDYKFETKISHEREQSIQREAVLATRLTVVENLLANLTNNTIVLSEFKGQTGPSKTASDAKIIEDDRIDMEEEPRRQPSNPAAQFSPAPNPILEFRDAQQTQQKYIEQDQPKK